MPRPCGRLPPSSLVNPESLALVLHSLPPASVILALPVSALGGGWMALWALRKAHEVDLVSRRQLCLFLLPVGQGQRAQASAAELLAPHPRICHNIQQGRRAASAWLVAEPFRTDHIIRVQSQHPAGRNGGVPGLGLQGSFPGCEGWPGTFWARALP